MFEHFYILASVWMGLFLNLLLAVGMGWRILKGVNLTWKIKHDQEIRSGMFQIGVRNTLRMSGGAGGAYLANIFNRQAPRQGIENI